MNLHVDRGLATTLRPIETGREWTAADGKTMCACNKRKTRCDKHKGGTKRTATGKLIQKGEFITILCFVITEVPFAENNCEHGRSRTVCPEESCAFS